MKQSRNIVLELGLKGRGDHTGMCMVKCGNKNQLIFKGGLHVFAWQGADKCGAEKCFSWKI